MQVIGWGGGKRGQVSRAQWFLGVWQSRERRRAQWLCWNCCIHKLPLGDAESSLTWTTPFVNSPTRHPTSCMSKSRARWRFLSMRRHSDPWATAEKHFSVNASEVVLTWLPLLNTDDKLLLEHKRKYIDSFYLPFVATVILAIHKLLRYRLSLRKLSACEIVSICIYK